MRRPPETLQVVALGLIQGAAELLPVSSSAHVAAVPWLLGWSVAEWAPERRKELEVALHAGALAALAPSLWRLRPGVRTLAFSLAPPVIAGYFLERPIEERLGGPEGLASGLLLGAVALVVADSGWSGSQRGGQSPATRAATTTGWSGRLRGGQSSATSCETARHALSPWALGLGRGGGRWALGLGRGGGRWALGLGLGVAQAAALWPGVSRTGATLAAARALGYPRPAASRLSFGVAGPVLAGATALKAWRGREGADLRLAATGAAAAFGGTRAALKLVGLERRGPLWPYAAERATLAGAILAVRYRRAR
jgi:undecaprenyl-diphosphatase